MLHPKVAPFIRLEEAGNFPPATSGRGYTAMKRGLELLESFRTKHRSL